MITVEVANYPLMNVIKVRESARNILKKEPGKFLMSRKLLGVPLRELLVCQLERMGEGVLVVDFEQIEDVSVSVAEELGPMLFEQFLSLHTKDRPLYLMYSNFGKDLLSGWQRIFRGPEKRLVACVFELFDGSSFTGHHFVGDGLPDALREVLNSIYEIGEANSTKLEERGIVAASRKLNALKNDFSWLVRWTQISLDERAWTYIYTPIVSTKEKRL